MIKVHVMRRGMWRCVYRADGWTFAGHAILALTAVLVGAAILR